MAKAWSGCYQDCTGGEFVEPAKNKGKTGKNPKKRTKKEQ